MYRQLGSKPKKLVELRGRKWRGNATAKVKLIDPFHRELQQISDSVAGWAKLTDFKYHGDSPQLLADRLCLATLAPRRAHLSREAILERQGRVCDRCGVRSDEPLEIHHRKPISSGGSADDPKNLVGLCRVCHYEETEMLMEAGLRTHKGY